MTLPYDISYEQTYLNLSLLMLIMKLKLLTQKEIDLMEKLGKDAVTGKLKGVINLIDELEKIRD